MILRLRQRHRQVFIALGVLLPLVFVAGIAARKPAPQMAVLPAGLITPSPAFALMEWERSDLFAKSKIVVQLRREAAGVDRFAVEFSAPADFLKPDLIVYWVAESTAISDTVPGDAQLLGLFGPGVALPLPSDAARNGGKLILFSLADQEIVEVSKPFALQKK